MNNFQDFINAQKANQINNKYYIGVGLFNVEFKFDDPVNNTRRLRITLTHPDFPSLKVNHFINFSTEEDKSSTGKYRYVDIKGLTSYYVNDLKDIKNEKFIKEGARILKKGEGDFIDFMVKFMNYIPPKEKNGVKPDYTKLPFPVWNIDKLINGDTSEFDLFFDAFKDNKIVAMIGVKESFRDDETVYYQEVFNKEFNYAWTYPDGNSDKAKSKREETIKNYEKSLKDPQKSSRTTAIFEACPLKEYVPGNVKIAISKDDMPF